MLFRSVSKIVYTSCVAVSNGGDAGLPSQSEYDRTKRLAHFEVALPLQARGLPLALACLGRLYGPGDRSRAGRLLRLYALKRLPVMVGGETTFNWTHVADAAGGLRSIAESGEAGGARTLAGPALSTRDFFAACERATGLPAPRLWLPAAAALGLARSLHAINPGLAELLSEFTGLNYSANADGTRPELNWRARSVEEGVADIREWFTTS